MTPQEAFDFRREARMLSSLLAAHLGFGLLQYGLLIFNEPRSLSASIAKLSGQSDLIAWAFFALALLLLPYLLMQLFSPTLKIRVQVVRLTVRTLLAAGVLRMYLAYLSAGMGTATVVFTLNALWCIGMAAVLAYSINSKQKRSFDET